MVFLQGWFRPKLNRQARVGSSQLRRWTLTPQATPEGKEKEKHKRLAAYSQHYLSPGRSLSIVPVVPVGFDLVALR